MELETGEPDDFSQGVLRQDSATTPNSTSPQVQIPTQSYPIRPRNARTHGGRSPTAFPPSLGGLQNGAPRTTRSRYQRFHSYRFSALRNQRRSPLDPKVFHYACHRLQFTPYLDLFANSENAQVTRFLFAYPMTRSCGVNAFNYDWSDDAGYANAPSSLIPRVLH